jgi:hypothetical protein
VYNPSFLLAAFNGGKDWDFSSRLMTISLDFLTEVDAEWYRRFPSLPGIYESRVRYYADRFWEGPWLDAMTLHVLGFGDCKSLAAARCAELRVRHGVNAVPQFSRVLLADGSQWMHVYVQLPDGRFEDPSRRLGMK